MKESMDSNIRRGKEKKGNVMKYMQVQSIAALLVIIAGHSRKSWYKRRTRRSRTIGKYNNSILMYYTMFFESQCSFHLNVECSRLRWSCVSTLCDWFKIKFAPLSQPIRKSTKPIVTCSHTVSRALRLTFLLRVLNWFT